MWLQSVVDRYRVIAPASPALVDSRRSLTWTELAEEARNLAGWLVDRTSPLDRVAIMSGNRVEIIVAYHACALAGVIACPLNPSYADPELDYVIGRLAPSVAVVDSAAQSRFPAKLPQVHVDEFPDLPKARVDALRPAGLDDPAMILQTSATTGHPKGVVVDQRSLQLNALSWLDDVRPAVGTRFLQAGPLFHGSLVIALDYLAAGCPVYVMDRFTPQACVSDLTRWSIEETFVVPSMLHLLLESRSAQGATFPALRRVGHGAAPMPPALARRAAAALDVRLHNVYGITEGGGPVFGLPSEYDLPEATVGGATCVGRPMAGVSFRVVDDLGDDAAVGRVGSLQIAGAGIMQGYWRNDEATAAARSGAWLVTGDLGYVDSAGLVWLVDRRTDLILRGGQNVYPAEIERVLLEDPDVTDAAVVGVQDPVWGQTPRAFVQATAGRSIDVSRLVARCVQSLSSYKRPSAFEVVDQIPRNPSGKILRRKLREHSGGRP